MSKAKLKQYDTFVEHPDGGHCNLEGMTEECYGCVYHGCALITECKERVKELKEAICKNFMIPREYLFRETSNLTPVNDPNFIKLVKGLHATKPTRIRKGHYLYNGYLIYSVGYYNPEHCVCWEAVDVNGNGVAHGKSMKECKMWVDILIERKLNGK